MYICSYVSIKMNQNKKNFHTEEMLSAFKVLNIHDFLIVNKVTRQERVVPSIRIEKNIETIYLQFILSLNLYNLALI